MKKEVTSINLEGSVSVIELTDLQKDIEKIIHSFCQKEIVPNIEEYDREERFPLEIIQKAVALGFSGGVVPTAYGGAGFDWKTYTLIIETFSSYCHLVALALSGASGLIGSAILTYGSEDQKEKYLKPLAEGKAFGAAGVTEPGSGTDVASMQTTVKKDGDYFILNGSKMWISFLDVAGWVLTFGTIDKSLRHKGICAFIIDRDTPGMSFNPIKNKVGFRPLVSGEIVLDNVKVHKSNLIGEVGEGFKVAMTAVENGRLSVAARATGVTKACLDESVRYAKERIVFGQPIGKFQLVQSKITDMVIGWESSRHFIYDVANLKDKGLSARRQASIAKMHASDVLMKTATDAFQIFGAYGCSDEYNVGRYFRDAKIFQIVEGNNDLHRSLIAQYALGYETR